MPIADRAMQTIEYALDGLERRSNVSADNIANLNTPGFRAARVDFESTLRAALQRGGRIEALPDALELNGYGLPDAAGNTVSLEDELTTVMETNLRRQAMVNAYNTKVGILRAAIAGR